MKMGYEDCPYHCNNGTILDYKLKKLVPCPYCSERRKELADSGLAEDNNGDLVSLPRILGIDNEFLRARFVYDSLIPEGERIFLEDDSVARQKEVMDELYLGLTVGQLPDRSYCFGLGNKGKIDRMAYPMLAKAYLAGLSVARFVSCTEYNRMCVNMDDGVDEFLDRDFVMVLIPDGASKADIASAKGLMQGRALKGKATIFVTTWVIEACSILLGYWDDPSYFLAAGSFVEYKRSKKGGHSHYINQLTGVENSVYIEESSDEDNYSPGITRVSMEDLLR